ncbi:hypothetical protein [Nocardia coubleae]|uniref:DUF8020 domain-containing protein n=1 Tax=Nocardia coubleae TaxID=356147 RepID=A0A846W6N0_9NOCA|nr:hypothetical protein [Nocardia coubleae]NKX88493.1 hypothetical protein [Nocardia coubleae]
MKFGKFTTAVVMSVVAVGITAATANGQPAVATEQPAVVAAGGVTSGVSNGIGYTTAVSPTDKTITWAVDNGRFELAADGSAVLLRNAEGVTVDQTALRSEVAGLPISVTPQIAEDGRSVKLAASMTPEDTAKLGNIAELKDISSYDRLMAQVNKNLPGIAIGGIIGAFFPFLWLFTIPAGMLIGGYVMGGQEFLDAVIAFATGQP